MKKQSQKHKFPKQLGCRGPSGFFRAHGRFTAQVADEPPGFYSRKIRLTAQVAVETPVFLEKYGPAYLATPVFLKKYGQQYFPSVL